MNQVKRTARRAFARGVTAVVDLEKCVGCGRCAKECPATVITIREAAL